MVSAGGDDACSVHLETDEGEVNVLKRFGDTLRKASSGWRRAVRPRRSSFSHGPPGRSISVRDRSPRAARSSYRSGDRHETPSSTTVLCRIRRSQRRDGARLMPVWLLPHRHLPAAGDRRRTSPSAGGVRRRGSPIDRHHDERHRAAERQREHPGDDDIAGDAPAHALTRLLAPTPMMQALMQWVVETGTPR